MADIESGLVALAGEIRARGIRSIAVPPLGSGLGGLKWSEVRSRVEAALRDIPGVEVFVDEPVGAPADIRPNRSSAEPKMTEGRAALVGLMSRYLGGLLDPTVSLLEVHKMMYFLQHAGEPLKLRYVQAPYGPYAENLRHVLRDVEGHLISGYADGGDAPDKQLAIVPGAAGEAERFLADHQQTQARLELLSTVHGVMTEGHAANQRDIDRETYAWNPRKRQFSPGQIAIAADRLRREGWVADADAVA